MAHLGFEKSPGGLYLPAKGPEDLRPRKIKVSIRDGKVNPDGAIIMHGCTIGKSREFAEEHYRKFGYAEIEFVEIPPKET